MAVRVISLAFGIVDNVVHVGDAVTLFDLVYGSDSRSIGVAQGDYEVVAEWDGGTEAVLGTVTLAEGTSFLVILPDVEGLPGSVVAF